MKQRILTTVILAMTLFSTQSVCAAEHVTSPDGNIVVTIDVVDGKPTYKVALDNVVFLKPSPLGVVMNVIDLTQELEMTACDVSKFEDEYSLKTCKQSQIKVEATKAVCRFEKKGRHVMDIIFMVTNRDVAYRYRLYPMEQRGGDTLAGVVESEASGFVLPERTTTFLCPQMKPMTGFARTAPSYETAYTLDDAMGKNG